MASSELLKQIQAGKKLKQTETNDRSAPQVETPSPKSFGGSNGTSGPSSGGAGGGPPQLGGLFAGGMPKLKPAGQSKLGTLGKPPSIPKSDGSRVPTSLARNVPAPSVPAPARPVPSGRNDMGSSAPLPPRRAPPAIRSESPPTPPRRRAQSPVSPASRSIPAVPVRNPVTSPSKPKVATPDRAPPPLPRSSHVIAPSPVRNAPVPPARNPPSATNAAARIDVAARAYSPEPTVPDSPSAPPRTKSPLKTSYLPPPPSRRLPLASSNGPLASRRKIPSPPPNAGVHTFPVTGFPSPRDFKSTSKLYKSGSQRGSNFNLNNL